MNINEILLENAELECDILYSLIESDQINDENIIKILLLKIRTLIHQFKNFIKRETNTIDKLSDKIIYVYKEFKKKEFKPFEYEGILIKFKDIPDLKYVINDINTASDPETEADIKLKEFETLYKDLNVIKHYKFDNIESVTKFASTDPEYIKSEMRYLNNLKFDRAHIGELYTKEVVKDVYSFYTKKIKIVSIIIKMDKMSLISDYNMLKKALKAAK